MKLLLVTNSLISCGGAARVMEKIARHFDATIHVVRNEPAAELEWFEGIDIQSAGSRLPLPQLELSQHFLNVDLRDYDIINAHASPSHWVRKRNSPLIWYCHTPERIAYDLREWKLQRLGPAQRAYFDLWGRFCRYQDSRIVPQIEHIFTNSRNTRSRISRYLKAPSEVLHPGVDAREFRCRDYEKFFFYPSRFSPEKDFEFVISAFREFSRSNPGWKLVLAGTKYEEAYSGKIRSLCDDSVVMETNITDERLRDLYSRCYCTLYAPLDEDFGLVPLEAMASSKPCLARDRGGPKETVSDGADGFLVSSPSEMAGRMSWLANNPDACQAMGRSGRKKVLDKFTWERFLRRFGQKAEELLSEWAGG